MILRSILFNIAFYLNLVFWILVLIPTIVLPQKWGWVGIKSWARTSLWWQKVLAGTDYEVRGRENIPADGFIVAAKHQSFWETFALLTLIDDPVYIVKRELTWIPGFGWYLWKMGQIPVNRGKRSVALMEMTRRAKIEMAKGRQLMIFPEGTRRPVGAEPAYKYGIAMVYRETGARVLPIALNAGLYWPRRKFERYPGTIIVDILPPIEPGLGIDEFRNRLERTIEDASNRLIVEAAAADPAPPRAKELAAALTDRTTD